MVLKLRILPLTLLALLALLLVACGGGGDDDTSGDSSQNITDGTDNNGEDSVSNDGGGDVEEIDYVTNAQAVIVPALAVDTLGNRLGQGSGFYDRALRALDPAVPVFAVAYEDEVLDAAVESVPTEPHDLPVDGVITPHRCLRFSPLWRR